MNAVPHFYKRSLGIGASWRSMVAGCLRSPAIKADAKALVFSIKSFAAAMLAYYLSLRIGLSKPSWAIVTVYIVSQASAGASLSRGLYRLVGTMVGAIATVLIIPNFVDDPILCSIVLAGWIGSCLYLSLLDRTPRSYAFVLAGYTASLIGFPTLLDPGTIFDVALMRVQEISIGILCAVLLHRFILPISASDHFAGKLETTLKDARQLAVDALGGMSATEISRDSKLLAVDLLVLQGLTAHLPYDPAPFTPERQKLRLLHDRLARLLPLCADIADRLHALKNNEEPIPADLLHEIAAWIKAPLLSKQHDPARGLIEKALSLKQCAAHGPALSDRRIVANLSGHLAELVGIFSDCNRLQHSLTGTGRLSQLHGPHFATGYVYHRDRWMAARAAIGAMTAILIGCAFWICSAWSEGGMALSIVGVCCTLFGNFDAPAPFLIKYINGLVYGVAISLLYSFVVLPQVADFLTLMAVLAPAFLLAGSLQARPPTTFMALGITLTIPILGGLNPIYDADFAQSLNAVLAVFAATGFAVISMTLFQTVSADHAIKRLLQISRRDVRRRAFRQKPDARDNSASNWTGLMIDRTALLLPRVQGAKNSYTDVLDDTLHHLRIGHAVMQIVQARAELQGETAAAITALLSEIARYFDGRHRCDCRQAFDLEGQIDTLMAANAEPGDEKQAPLIDHLIDLRFALGIGLRMEARRS
ncbi:fusaric acid resistance protein [Brucella pseudogrignonensis]|uniref:FUSC family protein n=1 Tax=Brucella pseudogrignonensis TaxID=419475 RepID=UPI0007DA74D5|nr:FUSC family protein [Brucella pseudogrignonensis]ANG99481.1 fusaric acid resistance protein [Brucella pseudogrignonensis]